MRERSKQRVRPPEEGGMTPDKVAQEESARREKAIQQRLATLNSFLKVVTDVEDRTTRLPKPVKPDNLGG